MDHKIELTRSATMGSIKFPQLGPRYSGMPRRYEETKPVVIQDFTHRKIVGIGHEIQRRLLDKLDVEKSEAVVAAEAATWEKAEQKKHAAVRKVREEAAKKTEQALEEQRKEHKQMLKEEVVRVEMSMQKETIEQVQEERAKGERSLKAAVIEVEERCANELKVAVEQAHQEEQKIAAENIKNLKEKHQACIEELQRKHVVDIAQQLALLTMTKDKERHAAVNQAHAAEQKVTQEVVRKLKQKYEEQLAKEATLMKHKTHEIEKVTAEMEEIEKEKERLAEFLRVTRIWFQDFIDRVQEVKKGEADFMLPPAYIEEIEVGLMKAKPDFIEKNFKK